ncbi:MAG: glycosyltransferase family A protein, partial [Mucilaginibacter sp.]|uniref:glycosyltransferase family A protein n=1 Tax=Mucilaginibacter sp. TaxID=1882438 RepID=UPI0034E3B426
MSALTEITFVIPTFNRNDYLIKILDTLPTDANVIVSDNGGAVTKEIINFYNSFLFITPSKKLEMYENWNYCINHVKTKWFIIPSDDDLYYSNELYRIFDAITEFKNCGIIIFGHNVIDERDAIVSSWKPDSLIKFNVPLGFDIFKYGVEARLPSIVFNTELAKRHGLFKEEYGYTAADSLLIQKCLLTSDSAFIPHVISAYRVWPNNFTSKLISTQGWLERIDKWQNEIGLMASLKFKESRIK